MSFIKHRIRVLVALVAVCLLPCSLFADESYVVDRVSFPKELPPEVGGVEFASDGSLYVALRRGDILVGTVDADPNKFKWRRFANGFHNACGIHVVKPGHIVIGQMAELTEVIDTDGDGVADEYTNLSTDFGLTGNYHETMDIASDGKGGYYIAPGTASHNGPTAQTPRGPYSKKGRFGRNYSACLYRGWVLHVDKDGALTPVSSGYRMQNGIELSPKGELWTVDNQGDWRAVSPVYHVTQDSFMGHPSSLVWDERFKGIENPLYMPRVLLDDLWNKPAFHVPHSMVHSCAEPVFDTTGGKFGPYTGQMFVPDQSGETIIRCMPEMVDGAYQGAAVFFRKGKGLNRGNNRLAFSPDGDTMYVGQTGRGWGNLSEGLQRIRYTGEMPFHVQHVSLTTSGFRFTFTKPLNPDSLDLGAVTVERYRYKYSYKYGSKEQDKVAYPIQKLVIDPNNPRVASIALDGIVPNYIYRLDIGASVKSVENETFPGNPIIYTLNRLRRPNADHAVTIKAVGEDRFRVEIDGDLFTEYLLSGFSKPILYPIMNASKVGLTRDWPITEAGRKGESKDHPHHKSLFIGHEGINGVDSWHEGSPKCGLVTHGRTIDIRSGKDRAILQTFNLWHDPKGEVMATDTRRMTFGVVDGARYIDLELNMHASHGALTFEEKKDGFVGLRTHPHLRLTAKPKSGVKKVFGHAANSVGDSGKSVWGQPADWVHYWGAVEGANAGIAILSHPSNPRSPSWWHARDYGLVSANPFGPKNAKGDGEMVLKMGDTLTLKYRFIFHDQGVDVADIASQYEGYVNEAIVPRTVVQPIPLSVKNPGGLPAAPSVKK